MKTILSFFGFDEAKHKVRTELLAGLTTFLTMSYILAVNPLILGDAGMDKGAVFTATVVAAAIATLVMAVYAKLPFALASGMGLNAFFAYTLVVVMGFTWQQALAAVFIEGVVFIAFQCWHPVLAVFVKFQRESHKLFQLLVTFHLYNVDRHRLKSCVSSNVVQYLAHRDELRVAFEPEPVLVFDGKTQQQYSQGIQAQITDELRIFVD